MFFLFFNDLGVMFSFSDLNIFHSYNCFLLLMVLFFVFLGYIGLFILFFNQKLLLGYIWIEFLCSFFPVFLLLMQIFPSLFLLWSVQEEFSGIFFNIKITGHQWYWTYELSDFLGLEFDSYMKNFDYYLMGDLKFLEVDNRLILPVNYFLHFVLSSSDVIHSWALPSFFIKLDVLSGVMTMFDFFFNLSGLFFGQCSEICGANHSFMPIVVELVLLDFFKIWVLSLS